MMDNNLLLWIIVIGSFWWTIFLPGTGLILVARWLFRKEKFFEIGKDVFKWNFYYILISVVGFVIYYKLNGM